MKLVIDENIAYAAEAFAPFGEVVLMHGRSITNEILKNADALIVRSITKVNTELLNDTNVSFVGTATIGTDHIDLNYLQEKGISFADAKGCNADAVTEYVYTIIMDFLARKKLTPESLSLGVIGTGNIGGRVARLGDMLGFRVKRNDPPLQKRFGGNFSSLDDTLQCDIVTFHTPLTINGEDPTFHLLNTLNSHLLKNTKLCINASRGEVIDTTALLHALGYYPFECNLDVWENEPFVAHELITLTRYSTAHIAGYSEEGKINGTLMMINALNKHFKTNHVFSPMRTTQKPLYLSQMNIPFTLKLHTLFTSIYSIEQDTLEFKKILNLSKEDAGKYFDRIRKEYPLRKAFNEFSLSAEGFSEKEIQILKAFRFTVV